MFSKILKNGTATVKWNAQCTRLYSAFGIAAARYAAGGGGGARMTK